MHARQERRRPPRQFRNPDTRWVDLHGKQYVRAFRIVLALIEHVCRLLIDDQWQKGSKSAQNRPHHKNHADLEDSKRTCPASKRCIILRIDDVHLARPAAALGQAICRAQTAEFEQKQHPAKNAPKITLFQVPRRRKLVYMYLEGGIERPWR